MDNDLPTVDATWPWPALVRDAGRLAARMLADGLDTQHKTSVSDVVSAADHAAEELIVRPAGRAATGRRAGRRGGRAPAGRGRTWFIDPVDGTYNFLAGLPFWCSAVALADQPATAPAIWRPGLGAVYHPQTDELWLAAPGRPTTCNGRPLPPLADAAAGPAVAGQLPASTAAGRPGRPGAAAGG